jgi:dockerin type I repeat protein
MGRNKWGRKTALLIVALTLGWIGITAEAADAPPCNCEILTVSGAGEARINGEYTYYPSFYNQYFTGWDVWLGPSWNVGSITGNWALLRIDDNYWILGTFNVFDGEEDQIYVVDGYYENQPNSRYPPRTGWSGSLPSPAPTIDYAGFLYDEVGDVNNDGCIDLLDVRLIRTHASGILPLPEDMLDRADLDEDGDVDRDDGLLLAKWVIGVCF